MEEDNGYIPNHDSMEFTNRILALDYLKTNNCLSVSEKVEFELDLRNLDRRIYRDPQKKTKGIKEYFFNIKQYILGSDAIYDIILTGKIYKISIISDNNILFNVINKYNNNKIVKIPIFNKNRPFPIINTNSNIQLVIEMNNSYNPQLDLVYLEYKCAYYQDNLKMKLINTALKIDLMNDSKIISSSGIIKRIGRNIPVFII